MFWLTFISVKNLSAKICRDLSSLLRTNARRLTWFVYQATFCISNVCAKVMACCSHKLAKISVWCLICSYSEHKKTINIYNQANNNGIIDCNHRLLGSVRTSMPASQAFRIAFSFVFIAIATSSVSSPSCCCCCWSSSLSSLFELRNIANELMRRLGERVGRCTCTFLGFEMASRESSIVRGIS